MNLPRPNPVPLKVKLATVKQLQSIGLDTERNMKELLGTNEKAGEAIERLERAIEAGDVEEASSPVDEDAQDEAGYFDYEQAERLVRQHRSISLAKARPRPTLPESKPTVDRKRRLFSARTPIVVPTKAEYPKISFLCKRLGLAVGPPALLIGISQSGKTFLAQSLGLCVATGRPFLGTLEVVKGPVVHIDYEQGQELSRIRYHRLMKGMGLALGDLADGDLDLYREVKKLDEPGAEEELRDKLKGKALCIIDSLRASISGDKDENSSGIRETIDMLGSVSESTGCTIVILHHQGKGNQRDDRFLGRGSSAIFEAAGAAYQLEVSGEYPEKVYRLWQTKTRMGFFGEAQYQLRDVGDHVEEIGVSEGIVLDPRISVGQARRLTIEDKIVDALRAKGELSADELAAAVGGRKDSVLKARKGMIEDGFLDTRKRQSDRREVFFLTETGEAWGKVGV